MAWREQLTDSWLSKALGKPVKIEAIDVLEAEGNSSSVLAKVRCFDADPVLVKATQVPEDALAASMDKEALFYRDAWKPLREFGVGLVELLAVEINADMSLVVLEFVSDGWQTGSNSGLSRGQAEALMQQLAQIHAWGLEGAAKLPWLRDVREGHILKHGLPGLCRDCASRISKEQLQGVAPDLATEAVHDMLQQAAAPGLYEAALEQVMASGPQTLIHMDARQGNAFFEKGGSKLKLFDWQSVSLGAGALDLAYTLSGSLTITDRRAWQDELLNLYHQTFCSLGGSSMTLEQLKADYRRALVWPLVWAALTAADVEGTVNHCAGAELDASAPEDQRLKRLEARRVAREFVTVGAQRYLQAAMDADSVACVRASL